MAGRLTAAASHILGGGGGAAVRASASALRHRAGMGLPVGRHIVPEKPLPTNDELVWDNGTPYPEPCIDRLAPHIGKYEALAWLCGGLGFFATLGLAAALNDKASKIPYEMSREDEWEMRASFPTVSITMVEVGFELDMWSSSHRHGSASHGCGNCRRR